MNLLGVEPPSHILGPLERIVRQSLVHGAPRPHAVVVEDDGGTWKTVLAELSLRDRRGTVLVARRCAALALGARWSVGGGLMLPPSTATMTEAFTAVRGVAGRQPWVNDPAVLRDLNEEPQMLRVALTPHDLWDHMVGIRGTVETLTVLAAGLGVPPVIDVGPSLLLDGVAVSKIGRAWERIGGRPRWAGDHALEVSPARSGGGDRRATHTVTGSWPVAELPSGQEVGRWTVIDDLTERPPDSNLFLDVGAGWMLDTGDGELVPVPELVDPDLLGDQETGLVRLPGWLALDLDRLGSPGAVLANALARAAARRGVRLWIPGVTPTTIRTVLRLEGRIWVDGPVVPDSRRKQ